MFEYESTYIALIIILSIIFVTLISFLAYIFVKQDSEDFMVKRFYMIIYHIYYNNNNYSIQDLYEQINLNYEKLCQEDILENKYTSVLDLLETLIYNIDAFDNDKDFKKFFKNERNTEIRRFIIEICSYIKSINPFISISKKEADLLQSMQNALINNNESLGMNSLLQLSEEILYKEKVIIKQEKDNKRTTILSIVGVILTIFFGIISIIQFLGIKLL